jgi:S1-C subfamily serine protease
VILGPGWAFLGLVVAGIAAFALIPACGLLVVDAAPSGDVRLAAPGLVDADPAVEKRAPKVASVSAARVRRSVRREMLRIRTTSCDGVRTGSGFALGSTLLMAGRNVVPGAAPVKVAPRKGAAKTVVARRVYRLGDLALASVAGRVPRKASLAPRATSGVPVAVVGYPLSKKPRVLAGVVVDTVAGAPFGIRGKVLRLTSTLGHRDPGGPVVDARGRIVGIAFTTDPASGLTVAAPVETLRAVVAAGTLERLPACDG